jgi:hypothetical protein
MRRVLLVTGDLVSCCTGGERGELLPATKRGADHFAGLRLSLEATNTAEQRFRHPTLLDGSPVAFINETLVQSQEKMPVA